MSLNVSVIRVHELGDDIIFMARQLALKNASVGTVRHERSALRSVFTRLSSPFDCGDFLCFIILILCGRKLL